MHYVHILAEGQTEETFVRDVLTPYFRDKNITFSVSLSKTKKIKGGPDYKGGLYSYEKVRNDILNLLKDSHLNVVTTMIDFYGLPTDFPGYKELPKGTCYQQVAHLETAFKNKINHPKFLPYFSLHEFEALVFVAPEEVTRIFSGSTNQLKQLEAVTAKFGSPEEINNDPNTAPSKRLKKIFLDYDKVLHGPLITRRITLDRIRQECSHFDEWLTKITTVANYRS